MSQSTDIKLPREYTPIFPDRCVACGKQSPTGRIKLATNTVTILSIVFLHNGSRFKTSVPACPSCARRMGWQKWWRGSIFLMFAIAGIPFGFWVLEAYKGFGRKWLASAVVVLFCMPYVLWELYWPCAASVTAYAEAIDYEFRDADYAADFAELNRDHLVSVSMS